MLDLDVYLHAACTCMHAEGAVGLLKFSQLFCSTYIITM